jgi:type II secretory pathway pseudopilin PulG
LIVVITIIGILSALVVPGASSLWSQRNEAASANLIRGLLQSVRTQAIRFGERGLFFYVDSDGTQRIAIIESDPSRGGTNARDQVDCSNISEPPNCVTEVDAVNRFHVVDQQVYSVPAPFRVAPSWALTPIPPPANAPFNSDSRAAWPTQLANERFLFDARGRETPQYHRSYFTVVYDSSGQLVVGRDVLIHDVDVDRKLDGFGNRSGDRTQLVVANPARWWDQTGNDVPLGGNLFDIVVLDDGKAANFTSVDGLVVYDDADIEGLDGASIRAVMDRDGQSLYMSRYTGEVILGPKGG